MSEPFSRRNFISSIGAAGAVSMIACGGKKRYQPGELNLPEQAPDGKVLKAGLIGCGGRGTGAAINFLNAGPNLEIVALGDVFRDRIEQCKNRLMQEKEGAVAEENCFVGFDAFEKVIDSGVDVVILATPPHFRPQHFAAAVNAKKHIFMEKPLAVDPVGIRSIMASAQKAEPFNLSIVTGTQRRHQHAYLTIFDLVKQGAIGDIVAANCYWNQRQLWHRTRKSGWSDMEYMIRDWVNWLWLSGDHIVEQHIHNIDVINWFTGSHPVKAVGFGGRHRRPTGDQYDFFSVDYVYDNGMHLNSMCRQINGCAENVSEWIVGSKGTTNCHDKIFKADGSVAWQYPFSTDEEGKVDRSRIKSPYDQEHINLVIAIRSGNPINTAKETAITNLTAIMGRVSAYSGKEVTWEEMINSNMRLGPESYRMGPVNVSIDIPTPGTA
jgi:myo-inositol 2-dehydrogenase / D-chiro-inositol 1-dehydrogenase